MFVSWRQGLADPAGEGNLPGMAAALDPLSRVCASSLDIPAQSRRDAAAAKRSPR